MRILNRKRSSSASGSGYVPSTSTGKRIRTFKLDRVLRRKDRKKTRKRIARSVERHLLLLHRLEQGGLRARRHAVDFVHQQQIGEDGAAVQRKGARRQVEDIRAQDVRRHQVRRTV